MKIIRVIVILLITTNIVYFVHAKLNIPKEKIPLNIPADIKQQIERLYSSNQRERVVALEKLGQMGERAAPAIPFIIGMLDDFELYYYREYHRFKRYSVVVSMIAVQALIDIGEPAFKPLVAELKNKDPRVRINVMWGLSQIADPRTAGPLIETLADRDSQVRAKAFAALCDMASLRTIEALTAALNEAREKGKIDDPGATQLLFAFIEKNQDEEFLRIIRESLNKIKDKSLIENLVNSALSDSNLDTRKKAIVMLGNVGDNHVVKPLLTILNDRNTEVRILTIAALEKIKDLRATEPLITLLSKDEEVRVRSAILRALSEIKDPRTLDFLINVLKDSGNLELRLEIIKALVDTGDKRAVEPLIDLLKDENESIRSSVALALGTIKDRRAIEPLILTLDDKCMAVRINVEQALIGITGINYPDSERWLKWWKKNKDSFQGKE
jgi:HEAT repeat protein